MTRRHRDSYEYRQARKKMFAIFGYTCHICGHDGAGEADHLEAVALNPGQPISPLRMRPSHGSNYPCPICKGRNGQPRACNQERGVQPMPEPLNTSQEW